VNPLRYTDPTGNYSYDATKGEFGFEEKETTEDLYNVAAHFESAGLVPEGTAERIGESLNYIEERYAEDEHLEFLRKNAVATGIRRGFRDRRSGSESFDREVVEAWDGRSYALKLNRAGVKAADEYAEGTVLVAGMLGVPTSKGDLILMVATAGGGYLVVKVGGLALRNARLYLRNLKAADEVVEWAESAGQQVRHYSDESAMRAGVAGENGELPETFESLTHAWELEKKAVSGADSAANRALHERFVDGLRVAMERPHVQDEALSGLLDDLYRPGATVGSGSTAAAVRHEAATGTKIRGRSHTQKAENYSAALQDWLNRNPSAPPGDRAAAENVLRDMQNALKGN